MKILIKIGGEAVALVAFLYGLVAGHIIGVDIAITIGVIVAVFLLSLIHI